MKSAVLDQFAYFSTPMISLRSAFAKFIELGLIIAILLLALLFYFAYQKIHTLSTAADLVNHTQLVRLELSQVDVRVHESATMQRRFLVTRDSVYLTGKEQRQANLISNLKNLRAFFQHDPVQHRKVDTLEHLIQTHLALLQATAWQDFVNRSTIWEESVSTMDSIQGLLRRMNQLETTLLEDHENVRDRSLRMAPFFAWLLLMLALIIAFISYLRIKNDLWDSNRQLEIHLKNTEKITELNMALQHAEQIALAGNWRVNLKTGERQYSDNVYRLFGYEPGAFPPGLAAWLPMVHRDDQQMVRDFGELPRQQHIDPPSIIFRFLRPDGQLRYLHAGGKIITTAQGEETLIGTVQDVTEAHNLRRELEERTRFAELVVESSVDMIAAYDQNLYYTVWNQRCVEVMNLKKEDVLGKHVFEVFPSMKGQEINESLFQALAGQANYIPPCPSLISENYFESYVLPLCDETNAVSGVLTVTHDVTESYRLRQELEERSRFAETIIESSVDMIITYDTDLRITAWNKKSEEVFRLTKAEVLGLHVEEVFPHIIGTGRIADLEAVLQGKILEYAPQELSAFGIYANVYLLPLKNHMGQVTGVLSITHDVSEVVQSAARLTTLNQSLEDKNKQLANINAELASFSYVASHDLQEPLRKIQAFASRILATEKDRLSEVGQDAFRRMQSAADRMQQLIEDLLTYSRTNTQAGEFLLVSLDDILHEAEQEVSETLQEKRAIIEADPLPPARVVAFQFRQLLANLLSNALKYQRPGVVPHIRISCMTVAGEDVPQPDVLSRTYFKIAVADNGIGFEPQYAERIFELFQRLHGRSEYKGTGIGLAICRKIMQNHQGYLLAEGRPGEGATFTIYLPV